MDKPINRTMFCTSGDCNSSIYIVSDPIKEDKTQFVLEESNQSGIDRLAPKENIAERSPNKIRLNCWREKLSRMDPLIDTDFLLSDEIDFSVPLGYPCLVPVLVWPNIGLPNDVTIIKCEQNPPSEPGVLKRASVGNE